jgi:hypothetical protein
MVESLITPLTRYIAFLPLAHVCSPSPLLPPPSSRSPPYSQIFEFAVELTVLHVGVPMGYATIKTLSDISVRNCVGDMREWKPTLMIGVPTVWETSTLCPHFLLSRRLTLICFDSPQGRHLKSCFERKDSQQPLPWLSHPQALHETHPDCRVRRRKRA